MRPQRSSRAVYWIFRLKGALAYMVGDKLRLTGLGISLLLFGLTLLGDQRAFALATDYLLDPFYLAVKSCNLIFLVVLVQLVIHWWRRYGEGDRLVRLFVKFFGIAFAVMFMVWLLVYPGIIGVDEANVLHAARRLDVLASWHHVLTNFYYAFALGLFPSWGIVTLLQVLLTSMAVAYVAARVTCDYGMKWGWTILVFLLLPQVLTNSVTPHRISLFAVVELLLLFMVWRYYHSATEASRRGGSIVIGTLTGIVAAWRTEAVVYLLLIPLCLWLLGRRWQVRFKYIVGAALVSLAIYIPVAVLQNLNTELGRQYQVTGLFAPLGSILRDGNYTHADKTYVKQVVDKAIDYDRLVRGDDPNAVYWSRGDHSISDEDLAALKYTTLQLIVANPGRYLQGALSNYLYSGLLVEGAGKGRPELDLRFTEGLAASQPFDRGIWVVGVSLLRGVDLSDGRSTEVYHLFYANALVGMVFILGALLLMVRKKLIASVFLVVIAKSGIIFLTVPMSSYLYYYPLMVAGGMLLILTLAEYHTVLLRGK